MNDDKDLDEFASLGLDREIKAPSYMKQRWHDSIELAAQQEQRAARQQPRPFNPLSFLLGAAVTAALAVGIGIGFLLDDGPASVAPNTYIAQAQNAPFERVMQVHLRNTEHELASMPVATPEDRTTLVLQIIQQNRLFEQAAEQNDADSLARVLRAFEPILLELAASDIAPEDAAALRDQLAFQLRVMLTKLERASSKETTST